MARDTDRDPADPREPGAPPVNAAEADPADADPEVRQDRSPDAVPDAPVGHQDPLDGTGYHDGADQAPGATSGGEWDDDLED